MSLTVAGGRLSTPGALPTRGPNGLRVPPNTPAYSAPATRTASTFAELQTQLNAAGSGDVIEFTGNVTGAEVTLAGGSTSWPSNVLIRPPLGQRRTIERLRVTASRVTLAGFDAIAWNLFGGGVQRSAFWRVVATQTFQNSGTTDCGLVECVIPTLNLLDPALDCVAMFTYQTFNLVRPYVHGCWIAGRELPAGSSSHLDTLQWEGAGGYYVVDPVARDSVFGAHSSQNAALQIAFCSGDTEITNCWIGKAVTDKAMAISADRAHLVGNDVNGYIDFNSIPVTVLNNRVDATPGTDIYVVPNGVGGNIHAPGTVGAIPPLGDLTELWPECPSTAIGVST